MPLTRKEHPIDRIAQGLRIIADALDDLAEMIPRSKENVPEWNPPTKSPNNQVSPYGTARMAINSIEEPFTTNQVIAKVEKMIPSAKVNVDSLRAMMWQLRKAGEIEEVGRIKENNSSMKQWKRTSEWVLK